MAVNTECKGSRPRGPSHGRGTGKLIILFNDSGLSTVKIWSDSVYNFLELLKKLTMYKSALNI